MADVFLRSPEDPHNKVEVSSHGQAAVFQACDGPSCHGRQQKKKKKTSNPLFFRVHPLASPDSPAALQQDRVESDEVAMRVKMEENSGYQERVGWEESMKVTCEEKTTTLHDRDSALPSGRGSVSQLIYHDVDCAAPGHLMSQFRASSGGTATQMEVKYKCCKFGESEGACHTKSAPAAHEIFGVEVPGTVDSDGSLLKMAQPGLEVDCGSVSAASTATGLKSWKFRNNADDGTQGGSSLAIDYTCCELAPDGPEFGSECESNRKTGEANEDDNIQSLFQHDVACSHGFAMRDWKMHHSSGKFYLEYTCCPIGKVVKLGPTGSCEWVGDPHFTTFDGKRHDPMTPDSGFYWIVKNDYIQIQSYYEGGQDNPPMRTRGIAVAGKFLLGKKFKWQYGISHLKGGSQKMERDAGTGTEICWHDGTTEECKPWSSYTETDYTAQEVDPLDPNGALKDTQLVNVKKSGTKVIANFPLNVKLEITPNSWWSDQTLTLSKPADGGFDGACGNFNGDAGDDPGNNADGSGDGQFNIPTSSDENMFFTDTTNAIGASGTTISLQDCVGEVRVKANEICSADFTKSDPVTQSFKRMCILDLCNTHQTTEQMGVANGNANAAEDALQHADTMEPRAYAVKARSQDLEPLESACGSLSMFNAKPRSDGELGAIEEAIAAFTGPETDMVYLGIKYDSNAWKWMKEETTDVDESVCLEETVHMWNSGQYENPSQKQYACLKKVEGTFKLFACGADETYNIACQADKFYAVLSSAGPVTARSSCGFGKQLAMPKTARDLARLKGAIGNGVNLHFLGGIWNSADSKWEWDDGTPFCNIPDDWWQDSSHAIDPTAGSSDPPRYFLCYMPLTNKLIACSGNDKRVLACESKQAEKNCPLSKQDMDLMKMEAVPGKRSRYQNKCFYLSPEKTTCSQFCLAVNEGGDQAFVCDADGLAAAAKTTTACHIVLQGFGMNIPYDAESVKRNIATESLGCSYLEKLQAGTLKKLITVTGPDDMQAPPCDIETQAYEHRPCACMVPNEYSAGHQDTPGDLETVVGAYSNSNQFSFQEVATSVNSSSDLLENGAANVALKFTADPVTKVIKRSYHLNGVWHEDEAVSTWPFEDLAEGAFWSVELTSTSTKWEVSVLGKRYASLDFPRDIDALNPDGVEIDGVANGAVALITPPAIAANIPASMNSLNSCLDHPFEVAGSVMVFHFKIRMTAVDGVRCIRCETTNFVHGSNIYMKAAAGATVGTLALDISGCAPKTQDFDYEFHINTHYDVVVHYRVDEKVAELYISQDRVEVQFYTTAVDVNLGPGYLGCYLPSEKEFAGIINDFYITHNTPSFRPAQDKCSAKEMVCQAPGYKLKEDATDRFCAGPICFHDVDQKECCDTLPLCNPGKNCPVGSVYKEDAGSVHCIDATCKGTPWETCCDATAVCTTYTCPPSHLFKPEASTTFCTGKSCEKVADEEKCCTMRANCSTVACPVHEVNIAHAHAIPCAGLQCQDSDLPACCVPKGKCTAYQCPDVMMLRPNAHRHECADEDCTQTQFHECCVMEGRCDSHVCPIDQVLKAAANVIYCAGKVCAPTDHGKCCAGRASCHSFGNCQDGYALVAHPHATLCQGSGCTTGDHSTCCTPKGTCSSYECPPDYRLKPTASSILCDDVLCVDTHYSKCCGLEGMCSSYGCPPTYVHKPDAGSLRCDGFTCSNLDMPMCCDHAATCDTHLCPPLKILKVNANQLFCKEADCNETDTDHCCVDRGICTTNVCPPLHVHRHNADVLRCETERCEHGTDFNTCCIAMNGCSSMTCPAGYILKDEHPNLFCAGSECKADDRDECCKESSDCKNYECPRRYVIRDAPENLNCQGRECTHADLDKCCKKEGFCLDLTCPLGWLHKPEAADIMCDDSACVDTPTEKCCAIAGKCNSFTCPDRYVIKFNSSEIDCAGYLCDINDRDMCCDAAMSCSEHICAPGTTLRGDHADLVCHDRYCTGEDHEMCCVAQGHCHSYKNCPEHYVHIQNEDLLCHDANCTDTEYTVCCAHQSKCNTYVCPNNFLHRDGAEHLDCESTSGCTPVDRDTCCDVTGTCGAFDCPAGLVKKALAEEIECEGASCTEDERLTCCTGEQHCDAFTCPPGFQHRHDAGDLFCEGDTCAETDYHICCVEEGHCHTYTCPEEYVHKINASNTFCADWKCRETDTDKCCDLRDRCNEEVCPATQVQRYDAIDHLCINRTCLPQDYPTCCTDEGKCSSMTCPPGYKHRVNANETLCLDENCTSTSHHLCCGEEDKCHTYSCPDQYIHTANAETKECQGFVCDDSDRDTCCSHQAWCNTYDCDFAYVAKADGAGILCVNSTCLPQDRDTCCDHQGTCALKDCPATHLHKPDSTTILCPDMRCLDTDFNHCCDPKATCLAGLTCPDTHVPREENSTLQDLYCAGFDCTLAQDLDTCCVVRAKCTSYVPPPGYWHKHNAVNLSCKEHICTDVDLHTCAAEDGHCSSFKCPKSYINRHDARHIQCQDLDCNNTEVLTCCALEGTCDTLHCPDNQVHREGSNDISCSGEDCTPVDDGTCCQTAATCNTYSCLGDTTNRVGASSIYCAQEGLETISCTEADQNTCCAEEGMCSTFPCPTGWLHLHNAFAVPCEDEFCKDTAYTTCCAEEGMCPTLRCPENFAQKNESEQMHCRDTTCTDADKWLCCDEAATCELFSCPAGFVWKADRETLRCGGRTCEQHRDRDACCERPEGSLKTDITQHAVSAGTRIIHVGSTEGWEVDMKVVIDENKDVEEHNRIAAIKHFPHNELEMETDLKYDHEKGATVSHVPEELTTEEGDTTTTVALDDKETTTTVDAAGPAPNSEETLGGARRNSGALLLAGFAVFVSTFH